MKVNLMRTEDFLSFALIFERQSCYVLGPPWRHIMSCICMAAHFAEMASARRQAIDRRFGLQRPFYLLSQ